MQDHTSTGGLIGDAFSRGRLGRVGDAGGAEGAVPLPDVPVTFPSAAEYDAVALFGAVWSVYDTATIPWVSDEIGYARSLISLGVPVLGICFGGQVLATAVGGTVSRAPIPEVGWVSVASDEPALIDAGPWLQWHYDRFTLPAEVPVLARTAVANQAFAYGRALGVQFHPEVTEAVLESWLAVDDSEQLAEAGIDATALIDQSRTLADGAAARAHGLVRRFMLDVARRPWRVPLPVAAGG